MEPISDLAITPRQLRVARAGLGLISEEIRALTGISRPTLKGYETDRADGQRLTGKIESYSRLLDLYRERGVVFGAGETVRFTK